MKVNELMIGDWVMRKDTKNPYEIKAIRSEKYCINNDNSIATDKAEDWSSMSYYEPIPLTPEILENNAYPDDGSWYCFGDFYVAHYGDCYVIHQNPNDDKRDFLCRISYVHELQHALRLCGLNDLADNFKIE